MSDLLLSICVPTYNRSTYLDMCLQQFSKQAEPYKDIVEIIVSDNCSPDNTIEIVEKYKSLGLLFTYKRQEENIGADRNFEWCFRNVKAKYCWFFGDDDLILDNKLKTIIEILQHEKPDVLYVKGYGYQNDIYKEYPTQKVILPKAKYRSFNSAVKYIKNVHYNITFASGNIINKSLLPNNFDSAKFSSTNLSQVYWTLEVLNKGKRFAILNELVMAIKTNNTGGYKLYETFSSNFNKILKYMKENEGMSGAILKIINFNLLLTFFPQFILLSRNNSKQQFSEENVWDVLRKTYVSNTWFWLFVFPSFYLPLRIGKFYQKNILNNINRVKNVFV